MGVNVSVVSAASQHICYDFSFALILSVIFSQAGNANLMFILKRNSEVRIDSVAVFFI